MRFTSEQSRVLRGMILALSTIGGIGILGYIFTPKNFGFDNINDQIIFTLKCEIFTIFWLIIGIARVANGRFFSPTDIAGSGLTVASKFIAIRSAFLQNTLEQVVLGISVHIILATVLSGREIIIIPLMIGLFFYGRLFFLLGYSGGAGSRAYGFGLTFYPTVMGMMLAITVLFLQ